MKSMKLSPERVILTLKNDQATVINDMPMKSFEAEEMGALHFFRLERLL